MLSTNELIVTNTKFNKTFEKTATYRKNKKHENITNEPITTQTHEQLDYTPTTRRWKNSVKNAESDTKANIDSDHYPVINTIKIKLTGERPKGKGRDRNEKWSTDQAENLNKSLEDKKSTIVICFIFLFIFSTILRLVAG
jgi:hypothetical protein